MNSYACTLRCPLLVQYSEAGGERPGPSAGVLRSADSGPRAVWCPMVSLRSLRAGGRAPHHARGGEALAQ